MISLPYRLFLFLLIFSPLAFGSRDPWALAIMEVGCVLGILVYYFTHGDKDSFYKVPGLLPLGLFLLWLLVQVVPLPATLVKLISPATYAVYQESLGVFKDVSWIPLSVAPGKTLGEFFRFFTYVGFYWLTVQLLAGRKRLKKTVLVVAGFAAVMALYAIVETLFTNGKIYGFYAGPGNNTHIGPYVYHNHFAGFMELVFPMVLALYLHYRPRVHYGSWRENLVEYFGGMGGHLHILLGFGAILMGTSVFLSLSRGGIISLSLSMICLIGFFSMGHKGSGRKSFLLVSILLITLSVSWFGWEPIMGRFEKALTEEGEITDGRFNIWEDGMGILKDFPLVGTGFGTFGEIYPTYRTFPGKRSVGHAHNDYLELVAGGGIVGLLLVAWFLADLFRTTWSRYRKRSDSYAQGLYLGSVSGLLAIFFHSVVDFNFYNNANGLIFFFICGLAVSASHTSLRGKDRTYLDLSSLQYGKGAAFAGVLFLALVLFYQGGTLRGRALFAGIRGLEITASTPTEEVERVEKIVEKAALAAPLNPLYPFTLARISVLSGDDDRAKEMLHKALRLSPVDGATLQSAARYFCRKGRPEKGRALFQAAILRDGANPEQYKMFAGWLLGRGEVEEGGLYLRQGMMRSLSKKNIEECISLLLYHGVSKEAILDLLPEHVYPRFVFADMMARFGNKAFSRDVIVESLDYIRREENIRAWHFIKIYRIYMKEKEYDMALSVLQEAIRYLPDNAHIHILAGDIYLKMGIEYRAVQEYKIALTLDPHNVKAQKRLQRLSSP